MINREEKKLFDKQKNIHIFDQEEPKIEVLNGRYGPYLQYKTKNYNVKGYLQYKSKEKEDLDFEDCKIIMKYPLKICIYKHKDVCVNIGPYGYYLRYNNKNYKIDQNPNKWTKEYILRKIN